MSRIVKVTTFMFALSLACISPYANAKANWHYRFVLPDKYVGWVQVIFNDPEAKPLPLKDRGYVISLPESGLIRTSDFRNDDVKSEDEFYYRSLSATGQEQLSPVPAQFVLNGFSHGGFGRMDTDGKGRGYSWYIFIGPPELRAKVPLANWYEVVEAQKKRYGTSKITYSGPNPTPGRMRTAP